MDFICTPIRGGLALEGHFDPTARHAFDQASNQLVTFKGKKESAAGYEGGQLPGQQCSQHALVAKN